MNIFSYALTTNSCWPLNRWRTVWESFCIFLFRVLNSIKIISQSNDILWFFNRATHSQISSRFVAVTTDSIEKLFFFCIYFLIDFRSVSFIFMDWWGCMMMFNVGYDNFSCVVLGYFFSGHDCSVSFFLLRFYCLLDETFSLVVWICPSLYIFFFAVVQIKRDRIQFYLISIFVAFFSVHVETLFRFLLIYTLYIFKLSTLLLLNSLVIVMVLREHGNSKIAREFFQCHCQILRIDISCSLLFIHFNFNYFYSLLDELRNNQPISLPWSSRMKDTRESEIDRIKLMMMRNEIEIL